MALLSDERYHYFDVRRITRVFEFEDDDTGRSMIRLDEDFSQRFTARFLGPDFMESTGKISHDNGVTWQFDFTMTYQRSSRRPPETAKVVPPMRRPIRQRGSAHESQSVEVCQQSL